MLSRSAALLGLLLLVSACATVWAQEDRPDTRGVTASDCVPCHQTTTSAVSGTWDAQAMYPEADLNLLRAKPPEEGWKPGHADRIPVQTKVRDVVVWQELLPKNHKRKGRVCLDCHLQKVPTSMSSWPANGDAKIKSLHSWLGTKTGWEQDSLGLWIDADTYKTVVVATVKVLNYGGGHRLPGGAPENIVLVVTATDAKGRALTYVRGHRLPDWLGAPYAEAPGFVYAKVYADAQGAPIGDPSLAAGVLADTRLIGDEHDELHFSFLLPESAPEEGTAWKLEAKLFWRPSWDAAPNQQVLMKEALFER